MARVFPAALAFARPEELNNISCDGIAPLSSQQNRGLDMSSSLSTASLMEVLRYNHNQGMSIHDDPAQFISEGSGRKWILTNTRFQTYWSAGFWEEVDRSRVPRNMQFDIHVTPPPPPRLCVGEHYSVYRVGHKIFMMTDYNGGTMTLELPGDQLPRGISQLSIKRRTYDETTGRWSPEQPATGVAFNAGPNGKILVHFQQVYRKALSIVEVRP
jgi:hypothetical protein